MADAASVVQLATKINDQSSNKVDLDEVRCLVPVNLRVDHLSTVRSFMMMLDPCIPVANLV